MSVTTEKNPRAKERRARLGSSNQVTMVAVRSPKGQSREGGEGEVSPGQTYDSTSQVKGPTTAPKDYGQLLNSLELSSKQSRDVINLPFRKITPTAMKKISSVGNNIGGQKTT